MLQSTRAAFNHLENDPTCLLCGSDSETLVHMLLVCEKLEDVRKPILEELMCAISELLELDSDMSLESQLQVIFKK